MPEYRRAKEPGGTFFFTVVTFNRNSLFAIPKNREILRTVWQRVQTKHPFDTIAICLLPDHIHTIWRLPENDTDYSKRWKEIKRLFTQEYLRNVDERRQRNSSRMNQGEAAIWQRRFWEHTIRDEKDFNNHIDYIHYNPLKHGLVTHLSDWQWSSFHKYVEKGVYSADWGEKENANCVDLVCGE